ncbi:MAG: hypothetical protein WAW42_05870 [Candidatus Competibacteraceae bacterium]
MKTTPALTHVLEVLKLQQEHAQALALLDAGIEDQRTIIAAAIVDRSAVDDLEGRLQDALAQQVAGETPAQKPETLVNQLLQAKTTFEKATADAAVKGDLARHTLAGLERRRASLAAQAGRGHDLHTALKAFFMDEQDAAGRAYIAAGDDLVSAYARIQAIQKIAGVFSATREGPPPFAHELDLIKRPQNMTCGEPIAYFPGEPAWLFHLTTLRQFAETVYQSTLAEYRQAGLPLPR